MTVSESASLYAAPPGEAPRWPRWLVGTVSVFLVASGLSDVFALYSGVRLYSVLEGDSRFAFAPQDELDAAYELYETAGRVQVGAYLLCAVVFVVWFFLMRRSTGLLAPDRFRKGPGWAVGGWFVPVACLWIPYRIAVDMWAAASPLPSGNGPFRAPMWPVNLWWGLFASHVVFSRYAAFRLDRAESLNDLRAAVVQYLVCDALGVAAAGAAVYFAFRLTALQERKIVQGPYLSGV
jgi:hypothetical protein